MARFLALFMILALLIGQGSSVAAAICHHQNAAEHIAARQSSDARIAAVSLGEEAAAAVASKKGSQSAGASVHWPAEMLPATAADAPFRAIEPIRFRPAVHAPLKSASVRPLLEPPSA
jgi:hypothetical protein